MTGPEPTHALQHWLRLQATEAVRLATVPGSSSGICVFVELARKIKDFDVERAIDEVKGARGKREYLQEARGIFLLVASQALRLAAWCHRLETRGGE